MDNQERGNKTVALGSELNDGLGVDEMIVFLAVNTETGKADRLWLEYDMRDLDECAEHRLAEGWEWCPFRIVPVDA